MWQFLYNLSNLFMMYFHLYQRILKKNLDKKKKTKFPATKCINRQMIFLYFKEQAIYNVNLSSQCNTCSSAFASYLVLTLIKQLSVLAINKSLFGFKKKMYIKNGYFVSVRTKSMVFCRNHYSWKQNYKLHVL